MDVTPDLVGIATNDEQRLAMRFQSDNAVNDVRTRFLQPTRPLNIGRLIETRAQFHDRGHLFAGGSRIDQCFDDRRITAGSIKRDLDRKHLRIARRLFDKIDNRLKTVIGMMQKHILTPHYFEHVRVQRQRWIAPRLKWSVLQIRKCVVSQKRSEMRHRQRAVQFVNIGLGQIIKFQQQLDEISWTICFDLQSHRVAFTGTAQLLLDGSEKILRFFVVNVEITVAGDAKRVHRIENQTGKQFSYMLFD